jgi:alpha-glucosidase
VWFDFWSGEEFGGGRSYDVDVRPDKPLLFVRGGGLVPVREPEVYDDQDVYNPLTIHIFPAGRGTGTYWFDDGRTLAWKDGTYVETRVSYDFSQTEMEVDQQSLNAPTGLKPDPYVLYRLHNVYKPRQVRIDSKVIPLFGDSWGITDTDRSAAWYESDHTLLIKTFRPDKDQTIQMSF